LPSGMILGTSVLVARDQRLIMSGTHHWSQSTTQS